MLVMNICVLVYFSTRALRVDSVNIMKNSCFHGISTIQTYMHVKACISWSKNTTLLVLIDNRAQSSLLEKVEI